MAYNINGKVFSDHPLMDEIVYNCKQILKGIVIKNDILAADKETETSLINAEMYFIIHDNGSMTFEQIVFNEDMLRAYGCTDAEIKSYLIDKDNVPESIRDDLTIFCNEWFIENFEEINDYYRTLMGIPPYDTGEEYYIYIDESYIPAAYEGHIDYSLPLHEQPENVITLLYANDAMDRLRDEYKGTNYSYILYLGDRSIDLYKARKANKWDILYIPNVYYLIEDRFTDLYNINRTLYINKSYQEFFAEYGDYYDEMMILIVIAQTFNDLIVEVPEWYIRRDVFDIRSCRYFMEAAGVDFYPIIPLKYQIRIVKNLNKLIKYKSSTKNIHDILEIFDIDGMKIYKYWLHKDYRPKTKDYDLEFVKSPIEESFDNYIRDSKYRSDYYSIISQDKFWNGAEDPEYIKAKTLAEDFTIHGTKFMGIEYEISMSEYLYQMEYFLGVLINSDIDSSDLSVYIPSINSTVPFMVNKLFLFLYILTAAYTREEGDESTKITLIDSWEGPMVDVNENFYDWKKKVLPEIFVRKEGRVHSYNSKVDMNALVELLERRHSYIRFGQSDDFDINPVYIGDEEYKRRADEWIKSMGVYDFIVPKGTISTFPDLIGLYKNNKRCYNKLKDLIINADNYDDLKTYNYVYQELYTRPFDKELFRLSDGTYATDAIDLLKDIDFILYQKYNEIMNESNIESRQEVIRKIMNDIIDTLEYYLSEEGLEYIFSFTTVGSFEAIVEYLSLVIGFFKSYKVYFLDPYISFYADDQLENSAKPLDVINEFEYEYLHRDKALIDDNINRIDEEMTLEDRDMLHTQEILDIYSYHDPDPLIDQDYDGNYAEELEQYTDVDGRYADDLSTYPYTMINAGAAYEGLTTIRILDGGSAEESVYDVYYQIDGGYEYHRDDQITDHRGKQMFRYTIDGGAADSKWFRTNSMDFYLKGTAFYSDVILSEKPKNFIEFRDDGLYLSADNYITASEFNNYVASVDAIINMIQTELIDVDLEFDILTNEDLLKERIHTIYDDMLSDIEYVLPKMDCDPIGAVFINDMEEITNNSVQELDTKYSGKLDPYTWTDL